MLKAEFSTEELDIPLFSHDFMYTLLTSKYTEIFYASNKISKFYDLRRMVPYQLANYMDAIFLLMLSGQAMNLMLVWTMHKKGYLHTAIYSSWHLWYRFTTIRSFPSGFCQSSKKSGLNENGTPNDAETAMAEKSMPSIGDGLKFLYKAAAAGAPPDAIAPANRSGSSSLQHNLEIINAKGFRTKMSISYLSKIIAALWHPFRVNKYENLL
jgi:hypothetical protein